MGDDGAGVRLIEKLDSVMQDRFDLIDCGTDLLRLATVDYPYETIFIVDALVSGETPGSIHWYRPDHIKSFRQSDSVHQLAALEAVFLLPMMNEFISESNLFLVGIEPACLSLIPELSEPVRTALSWLTTEFTQVSSVGLLRERCEQKTCTPVADFLIGYPEGAE